MHIFFYGNCQVSAVMNTFLTQHSKRCLMCWQSDITEDQIIQEIKLADVIITQPIADNYRDKHYLSTKYIIKTANYATKIIIFPSLHFDFYISPGKLRGTRQVFGDAPRRHF